MSGSGRNEGEGTVKRYWFVLVLFVGAVLAINYWCLPAHDELGYTFQGECTPIAGEAHHVQNLMDVVRIQIADYQHGPNGRVFLHGLVCLFSGWELYTLFDFINTGMWFLFVWLLLREGGVKVRSIRTYVIGTSVCFLFLWHVKVCCYNAAFAVNYLWSACITVGFLNLWRRCGGWWMVPVCFLYGWWMEVFSMPMIAALGCCALIGWVRTKRFPWTVARCVSMAAMILGGLGCCGSHFVSGRAAETGGQGLPQLIVGIGKAYFNLAFGIWPAVLIIAVLLIMWRSWRCILALYDDAPEWWMYFLFGFGVYFLLGKEGMRLGCPMFMAGTILLIRNRFLFVRLRRLDGALVWGIAFWMVVGAVIQYRIGDALAEMERVYAADPQGITYRRAIAQGPWGSTVSPHMFNRWHRALYKHKYRHACEPAVLSPHLYQTLYQNPSAFFAAAEPIGDGIYRDPVERGYVVQRGDAPLSASEQMRVRAWLGSVGKPSGWRKCLPGRLGIMFPASDFYVALPQSRFVFTAKDGNVYTLYVRGGG